MISRKRPIFMDLAASMFVLIMGLLSFLHVLDLPMTALDSYPIIAAAQVGSIWELPDVLGRELRDRIDPGMSYYRPLELLTYSVDYLIWKLDPRGYQLTDLCLHGLAGAAVFWLGRIGLSMSTFWAAIGGLFFLLHPATVEVVPAVARRQEPLLVIGLSVTILGARAVLTGRRSAWFALVAGTIMSVTSVERGLMVPAVVFAYFCAFGKESGLCSRFWSSAIRSLPSAVIAVAFYVLRSALFEDSRIDFALTNLVQIPALATIRTFYPQEFLGRLRTDSPLSALVFAGALTLVLGFVLLWLTFTSKRRGIYIFTVFSALSYVLLFSVAGIFNSWYVYTIVPFFALSLSSLLEEGFRRIRSTDRVRGVVSVLATLFVVALTAVPSPMFFDYPAWRIAGALGANFLDGVRKVTDSLPEHVAVVVINTPYICTKSRSSFVETRQATILYPKTVRTWARLNGVEHEIVVFGVSRIQGEFTTPEIDFKAEGTVRLYFGGETAEYLQANDPHVRGAGNIAQGVELMWPPQGLASRKFKVYVFDGEDLVPIPLDDPNG